MVNNKALFQQSIKYSILAQKAGNIFIPETIIKYYDDNLKQQEMKINSFAIKVNDKVSVVSTENYHLKAVDNPVYFRLLLLNPFCLLIILLSVVMPVLAFFYGNHQEKMTEDSNYSRRFLANKRLSKYFSEAKKLLENKSYKDFYTALQKGIFYYITDKLNIPSGIGYKELINILRDRNISDEKIGLFEKIYQDCSKNAYSTQADESIADEILSDSTRLVEKFK